MASISEIFGGVPAQTRQTPLFSPQSQQLQNQSIQQALSLLQGPQNYQQGFQPIAQQARQQFQTQTIPTLAERFTSLGGQRSSAFQGALGQAGAGLEQNLAALGSQYGLSQQRLQNEQLRNLLAAGLQPSFSTQYIPREIGIAERGLGTLAEYLPKILAGLATGGFSELANLFKQKPPTQEDRYVSPHSLEAKYGYQFNPQPITQFGQTTGQFTAPTAYNPLFAGLQKGFYGL